MDEVDQRWYSYGSEAVGEVEDTGMEVRLWVRI